MKIRVNIEVDLDSGDYDVRLDNLTTPGRPVPLIGIDQVVARVMERVVDGGLTAAPSPLPTAAPLAEMLN